MSVFGRVDYRKIPPSQKLKNIGKSVSCADTCNDVVMNFDPNGKYDHNTDIMPIHKYVCSKLTKNCAEQQKLITQQLEAIEQELKINETMVEIYSLNKKKAELLEELDNCKENKLLKEYMSRVEFIIESWKTYKTTQKPIITGQKNEFSIPCLNMIRFFMQIVRDYGLGIHMQMCDGRKINVCPYCYSEYRMDDDIYNCDTCGIFSRELLNQITYDDMSSINNSFSHYHNKEVFISAITRYQGLQIVDWNFPAMKEGVIQYCKKNEKDYMTLTPMDIINIFDTLTVMNKEDKKAIRYNDHYEDANLFTHKLNGWPLPNIEMYVSALSADYDKFYQVYEEVKGTDRSSALNGQFILLKLIQRRKIPYRKENFKLPETVSIIIAADNKARDVFKILEERRIANGDTEDMPWKYQDTA